MFVQHYASPSQQVAPIIHASSDNASSDFDLIIQSKNKEGIKGKIVFTYLHQNFEASIAITQHAIQINSQLPFEGITTSAPELDQAILNEHSYLHNGTVTKFGAQNIVWLMLDLVHLYNVLRFKPGSILEIYRSTVAFAKTQNDQIVFGHIPLVGPLAKSASNILVQNMKRKHKYTYSNPLDLLASIQLILENYPQQFLLSKKVIGQLESILV